MQRLSGLPSPFHPAAWVGVSVLLCSAGLLRGVTVPNKGRRDPAFATCHPTTSHPLAGQSRIGRVTGLRGTQVETVACWGSPGGQLDLRATLSQTYSFMIKIGQSRVLQIFFLKEQNLRMATVCAWVGQWMVSPILSCFKIKIINFSLPFSP